MQTPLEIIAGLGAPTDSCIKAIAHLKHERNPLSKHQAEQHIAAMLVSVDVPSYSTEKEANLRFLYLVQETLRLHNEGKVLEMDKVWDEANCRADQFIAEQPWSIKDYNEPNRKSTVKPTTKPEKKGRKKKGPSKGKVAEEIYLKMKDADKADVLKEIVKVTGTTPAGANTYYCAAKKKHG